MEFPVPLTPARLIRRYKRFLADVELESGEVVVAHCPNPGAMTGLAEPGMTVWLEPNDDPKKKLNYGWRLVEVAEGTACIHTGMTNGVVAEALAAGGIPGLGPYDAVRTEVAYGEGSRVDFLLTGARETYLEVKCVTLRRAGRLAEFPDTVTKRGAKHLAELAAMAGRGARAVMLYVVQRDDCDAVSLAGDIDPAYVAAFDEAAAAGVEALAFGCRIDRRGVMLDAPLPFLRQR